MSVTLATARQQVALRAQEFLACTATGGTSTTIIDTNELWQDDNYWDETYVLFTNGTNNNILRRSQTFTSATATIALYTGPTASVGSGDTFELYRRFPPADIYTAINRSLNVGAPDFRERVRAVITATMDTLTYDFPASPMMLDEGLVSIEYQWYTQANQATWPFQKMSTDMYEVIESWDPISGTSKKVLQLKFNPETNKLIRFTFDGPVANVASPSDLIHLDLPQLEWMYTQATAELWRMEVSRTSDATRKSALEELARHEIYADRLRKGLAKDRPQSPLRRSSFRVISGGFRNQGDFR